MAAAAQACGQKRGTPSSPRVKEARRDILERSDGGLAAAKALFPGLLEHYWLMDTILSSLSSVARAGLRRCCPALRDFIDRWLVAARRRRLVCVCGGDTGYETGSATVHGLELGTDGLGARWVDLPCLITGRIHPSITALSNGDILVAGGSEQVSLGHDVYASAELFEQRTGAWRTVSPMSQARTNAESVISRLGVVVIGGCELPTHPAAVHCLEHYLSIAVGWQIGSRAFNPASRGPSVRTV